MVDANKQRHEAIIRAHYDDQLASRGLGVYSDINGSISREQLVIITDTRAQMYEQLVVLHGMRSEEGQYYKALAERCQRSSSRLEQPGVCSDSWMTA